MKTHKSKIPFWLVMNILSLLILWRYVGPPGITPRIQSGSSDVHNFKTIKSITRSQINFDSRSSDAELRRVKEFMEDSVSDYKTIDIRFQMKAHSTTSLGDIFQTANSDDGIRMEVSAPATLSIVTAYVYNKTRAHPNGREILTHLKTDQWYFIHIRIDDRGFLHASINEGDNAERVMASLDIPVSDYAVSDIVVGSGYSKTRPFDGMIRDFTVDYRLLQWSSPFVQFLAIVYLPLTTTLIISLIILVGALLYQKRMFHDVLKRIELPSLTRHQKIRCLVFVLITGFIATVFYHYIRGMYLEEGFPVNTPLPIPADFGGDLRRAVVPWPNGHFFEVPHNTGYFPSAYLISDVLSRLKSVNLALTLALSFFCVFLLNYVYKNVRTSDRLETLQNTIVCALMSYPFLFILQTANFEMFVFMFLVGFIGFYQQRRPVLASFCLAMPLSMKLFPAVFLVLFLSDKRYKELLYTLLWTLGLSLVPLLIFEGGLRSGFAGYVSRLQASQAVYSDLMVMGRAGLHYGHSLLGAIRILMGDSFPPMQRVLMPWLLLSAEIFGALSVYILIYEKEFWKKVALLVIAMDLLPYTSTDYKLIHMFIPLFLFMNTERKDALDVLYTFLFSLLLIPKDYFSFHHLPLFSINNVLNPLFMIMIALLIMGSGFLAQPASSKNT